MSLGFRSIFIVVGTAHLLACSSWKPVTQPLPEHLAARPEATLRLTLTDGQKVELDAPRVSQDSVVGFSPGGLRTRTAIALNQVTVVEHSRTDTGKTLGVALIGVGVAVSIAGMVQVSQMCLKGPC